MEPQERIVSKAHELFMRYGIRSVSMDEVANHLGMSKKTIYQFYADKDALVEDVINIEINEKQGECKQHRQKSENAIHEFFMATDMLLELLTHMNPALIFDMEKYHPKAFKKYNDHKNSFLYTLIKDNIEWGKKEGLYREEVLSDVMARFRLGSIFLIFNPEVFPGGKHTLPVIVSEITDNFLFGLASAKGQKLIQKYKQQRQKP
ncbi:MAG: TetR/AcrR family transcriptional regulator [Sediminibacterium sp.]